MSFSGSLAHDVHRQRGAGIACLSGCPDLPRVIGHAGNAQQTGLLVQGGVHLVRRHAGLLHHVGHDGGVDGAAPGTHGQTLLRREAHGGIHRLAVPDCRNGGTAADVAGHNLQLLQRLAHKACRLGRNIAVERCRGARSGGCRTAQTTRRAARTRMLSAPV